MAPVPARRAAALGRRDGRPTRRAGDPSAVPRGRRGRHRLSARHGLRRGVRGLRRRSLGLGTGGRRDPAGARRDDGDHRGGQAAHRAGRLRDRHTPGVPAVLLLFDPSRPPGRDGAARSGQPAGPQRPGSRVRPPDGRGWGSGDAALQPAQPDRNRPLRGRADRTRRARRRARCGDRGGRDPRATDHAGPSVHSVSVGAGRRAWRRGHLGRQGLEPRRSQGGPRGARSRGGGRPATGCRWRSAMAPAISG